MATKFFYILWLSSPVAGLDAVTYTLVLHSEPYLPWNITSKSSSKKSFLFLESPEYFNNYRRSDGLVIAHLWDILPSWLRFTVIHVLNKFIQPNYMIKYVLVLLRIEQSQMNEVSCAMPSALCASLQIIRYTFICINIWFKTHLLCKMSIVCVCVCSLSPDQECMPKLWVGVG